MPSIKANALNGLKFVKLAVNSLISMWAAGVTVTDTIGLSVGDREILNAGAPNIEISADVVDTNRDQITFAEPAEAGEELFMPVVVTTALGFLVLIDEL